MRKPATRACTPVRFALGLLLACAAAARAVELPPRNPFLADSNYPIGHGDSAQQDAVAVAGPLDPGPAFAPADIRYAAVGPAHFGAFTSGRYADGRRVYWSNGLDRIVKVDYASYRVLATFWLPGARRYTEAQARESVAGFDAANDGLLALWQAFREGMKLRDLSSVYTLLDRDNTYFIADKNGSITAYGDADPRDPASAIVVKGSTRLPAGVTGLAVGMNMSFDGWLIVPTEHGYVVAIKRDFSQTRVVRMKHSEGVEQRESAGGYGWIRNSLAIDSAGGIYIASEDHMHKLVWTGDRLSVDERDGAWTARYANGWTHGTGATPTLMGFGAEDRFVVITDGEPRMNLVLFWRDAIPANWKAPGAAPDPRIAGMLPADMGDPALQAIQSEQSVVVSGHGALVVNNMPRNVPWYLPARAAPLLIGYLGSSPVYQPFGVQKFDWDPVARTLRSAWVNREVSSPSTVPIASYGSGRVYLIGARANRWTLEALDWRTGESAFHATIGGQRYNPLFSGTLIDDDGRVHYGTPWGRVRLEAHAPSSPAPR